MVDQVERLDVRADDNVSAAMNAAAESLNRAADAADNVTESVERVGRSATSFVRQNDAVSKAATALSKVLAEETAQTRAFATAMDQGKGDAEAFARAQDTLAAKVEAARVKLAEAKAVAAGYTSAISETVSALSASASAAAEWAQRTSAMADATQKAVAYQQQLNAALGVPMPGDNTQDRAADVAAYGAEMDRLRAKYDPLFAASKRYSDSMAEIATLEKQGVLTTAQASVAVSTLTEAYAKQSAVTTAATAALTPAVAGSSAAHDAQAKAAKGGAMALRDLAIQSQDLFVQIQGGGSIMTAFIQQGSQVSQQLMASGQGFGALRAAGSIALGALLSPMGLLVTGTLALGGAFAYMVAQGNASLGTMAALQTQLRGTHEGYAALAMIVDEVGRKVSASSGLGLKDATAAAAQLAQGRYFSGTAADLERLTRDAADLGAVMGGDAATGAKTLADALDDPAKAAAALAPQFSRVFGPDLVAQIDNLQRMGKQGEAFSTLLGTLERAAGGAARDGLSPLARAWQDLGNAFTGTGDGWRPLMEALATTVANTLASTAREVRGLADALRYLKGLVAGGMPTSAPIDATNGKATNGVTLPGGVSDRIYSIAEANGISPVIADLATRVAKVESGGQQFRADGSLVTSGAGAIGMMQLMPGTAAGAAINPGGRLDPAKPDDNILLGLRELARLGQAYGGDERKIASGYNAGQGRTDAVLAGRAALPDETAKYVRNVTGQDFASGGPVATSDMVDNQKAMNDQLAKTVQSTREFKAQQYAADLQGITDALEKEAAANGTGTARFRELSQAADDVIAKQYANVDAMTAAQRSAESGLRATAGMTSAEQALAAAIEARSQTAKAAGMAFTSTDEAAAVNNVLRQQSQEYARTTFAMAQAAAEQGEMATAYGKGNQAVVDLTARQAAYSEALKLFPRDTAPFNAAIKELIGYYQQAAVEAGLSKTAQENATGREQLAYIQQQTAAIGQNERERSVLLATMQAEQEMHRRFGDVLPAEAQGYIALKVRISEASSEMQRQQAALAEVSGYFTNTFDTISNAITQAFATGELKALKFGDLLKSVASSIVAEFAKLAVLNPLKGMLFGAGGATLGDVGGLIGNLFNGGTAAGAMGVAGTVGAAIKGAAGTGVDSQLSVGNVLKGAGAINQVSNIGGDAGGGIIATLAEKFTDTVTGLIGNSTEAINIAAEAGNLGNSGVLSASISNALGFSNETSTAIAAASGRIADALPYVGAVLSVVTNLVSGNYRGAGLVAGGATIGGIAGSVIPGIGTAVGVAVGATLGAVLDMFLPNHPKHPFEDVELNVQGGKLVTGKSDGQLADVAGLVASTRTYADQINDYLNRVGVRILNMDGNIGRVGQGITGLDQTMDMNTLFHKLAFDNDPSDTSQFGIAKGALNGMTFDSPQALADELAKIAAFADAAEAVGIRLAYVAKDISNIKIAAVVGGNPDATSTVTDGDGRQITYKSDLKTALNNDLPGLTFENAGAIDAEIQKVAGFLGSTLPQLLTPTKATQSSTMDQYNAIQGRYAEAAQQSKNLGLDNTDVLRTAMDKALAILMEPATRAIQTTMTGINLRFATLAGGTFGSGQAANDNLAMSQANERAQLEQQWRETWGDSVVVSQAFNDSMKRLIATQELETAASKEQADLASKGAASSLYATVADAFKRAGTSPEWTGKTALLAFDLKADQESAAFRKQWTDFYGAASTSSQEFQDDMAMLDAAHYKERLALQQQYISTSQGMQSVADRNAAGQVVTSLAAYARTLQTSAASPLTAQGQYSLASGQFNAVASAARAGDYTSVSQLQSYADAFLTASRGLNGSGAAYAQDFQRVLDALSSVADGGADALTASYMASIAQQQTDQLVAELQALRAEVTALRTETAQAGNAPARVAA